MLGLNHKWIQKRAIWLCLLLLVVSYGLSGCGDRLKTSRMLDTKPISQTAPAPKVNEVAPPPVIQKLHQDLEKYRPQVTIIAPQAKELIKEKTVNLQVKVGDLPIFKDSELKLGPHLNVILDNQPYGEIYDIEKPLVLEQLSPGTHTLQVFAVSPWNESFKNQGAYAQTTFNIVKKTENKVPDLSLPLLTYNSPEGKYGAEPILLDFYLTNISPDKDKIVDYQVRVTIDGDSFLLDSWQPFYFQGFQAGKNSIQLELLDRQGDLVGDSFNKIEKEFTYEPKAEDSLSKIIRGEISADIARKIVDPNYKPKPVPVKSPAAKPTSIPKSTSTPKTSPEKTPEKTQLKSTPKVTSEDSQEAKKN